MVEEVVTTDQPVANLDQALYLQGQIAAAAGQWKQVGTAFQRLVKEVPESPLRLEAEYWLAESSFHLANNNPSDAAAFEEAQTRFNDLAEAVEGQQEPWMAMVSLLCGARRRSVGPSV